MRRIGLHFAIRSGKNPFLEMATSKSDLINKLMVRWMKIYKPHIRVSEYNQIIMHIAKQFSGNAGKTAKSLLIDDSPRKLVFLGSYCGSRKSPDVIMTNTFTRMLYSSRARLDRFRKYMESKIKCTSCGVSMDHEHYYRHGYSRDISLELCGGEIRARNWIKENVSNGESYHFCADCRKRVRSSLNWISESEAINADVSMLRKQFKKNEQRRAL